VLAPKLGRHVCHHEGIDESRLHVESEEVPISTSTCDDRGRRGLQGVLPAGLEEFEELGEDPNPEDTA
jgi:hypothetical protein